MYLLLGWKFPIMSWNGAVLKIRVVASLFQTDCHHGTHPASSLSLTCTASTHQTNKQTKKLPLHGAGVVYVCLKATIFIVFSRRVFAYWQNETARDWPAHIAGGFFATSAQPVAGLCLCFIVALLIFPSILVLLGCCLPLTCGWLLAGPPTCYRWDKKSAHNTASIFPPNSFSNQPGYLYFYFDGSERTGKRRFLWFCIQLIDFN